MIKFSKAQGLSINVIVIAAIVLVVLIVLIAVFSGGIERFTKGIEACKGRCVPQEKCLAIATEGECEGGVTTEVIDEVTQIKKSGTELVCCLLEQ